LITPAFDGIFNLENRYHFTNLNQCAFRYELKRFNDLQHAENQKGKIPAPDLAPGQKGVLKVPLPADWKGYDVLYVTATDPHGQEIFTWSWNITTPENFSGRMVVKDGPQPAMESETADIYLLSANGVEIQIDRKTGLLSHASSKGKEIPLGQGPLLIDGDFTLKEIKPIKKEDQQVVEVTFSGRHKFNLRYILFPSGWLELDYSYRQSGSWLLMGITFTFPENMVKGAQLLANGPYRVWKNRLKGGTFNQWEKKYNNTVTGESWDYPEFKGYYSDFYGVRVIAEGTPFTVLSGTEDLFLHLFTPEPPRRAYNSNTSPVFPKGNLSFLHGISPIGTKFQSPEVMGPQGGKNMYMPNSNQPDLSGKLYFDFR
jgi:hypothetical protein